MLVDMYEFWGFSRSFTHHICSLWGYIYAGENYIYDCTGAMVDSLVHISKIMNDNFISVPDCGTTDDRT